VKPADGGGTRRRVEHSVPCGDACSPITVPVGGVGREELTGRIEARIPTLARIYLSFQENQYYPKDHTVTDPVAGASSPERVAGAALELRGKTCFVSGDKPRRAFEEGQAERSG
jgi:hypothetical protein